MCGINMYTDNMTILIFIQYMNEIQNVLLGTIKYNIMEWYFDHFKFFFFFPTVRLEWICGIFIYFKSPLYNIGSPFFFFTKPWQKFFFEQVNGISMGKDDKAALYLVSLYVTYTVLHKCLILQVTCSRMHCTFSLSGFQVLVSKWLPLRICPPLASSSLPHSRLSDTSACGTWEPQNTKMDSLVYTGPHNSVIIARWGGCGCRWVGTPDESFCQHILAGRRVGGQSLKNKKIKNSGFQWRDGMLT